MFTCHPLPRHQHGWPHVREGVGGVQRAGDDTKWRSDVYEVVGHPDRSGKCCSDEKLIFSRLLWRRWDQWNKKRLLEGVSTFKSKSIGVKNTNPRRVDTLIAKKKLDCVDRICQHNPTLTEDRYWLPFLMKNPIELQSRIRYEVYLVQGVPCPRRHGLGWLRFGEFPGRWAATVATYCLSRMVEHPKSKSIKIQSTRAWDARAPCT